jgi:Zn-dependent protease with chaperone function
MSLNKHWNYAPLRGRIAENAATAGAVAVYGAGLAQIFNPAALGLAAAYAAGHLIYNELMTRYSGVPGLIRDGYISPLPPQYKSLQTMADDMAKVMGIWPPKIFVVNDKMLRAMTPWYMRWQLRDRYTSAKYMRQTAAAISNLNMIMMGEQMMKHASDDEMRFIMAHEMGHVKNGDSSSLRAYAHTTKKHMGHALLAGTALAIGAAIFGSGGVAASLLLGAGAWPVLGPWLALGGLLATGGAARLFLNGASLVMEKLADRNAIYVTRDAEGANRGLLEIMDGQKTPPQLPPIVEVLGTHPTYHPRVANIRAAWQEAASHPVPPTAVYVRDTAPLPRNRLG